MGIGSPFFGRISDMYGFRTMYVVAGVFILFLGTLFSLKAPSPSLPRTHP